MRILSFLLSIMIVFAVTGPLFAQCTTIQDGTLMDSEGIVITPGFNDWGHNYQARTFNGGYCDSYRNAAWCQEYAEVDLQMKWNAAWLNNVDCDHDELLDRHYGLNSYIGSGAWLTNHQSGKVEVNGKMRKWTYFVKIVAVNEGDTRDGGYWYRDGIEVGWEIWGQFAVIEEVLNDPSTGDHGILYQSPVGPGVGQGHVQ